MHDDLGKGGPVTYPVGCAITLFDGNLNQQCRSKNMVSGTGHVYGGLLKLHVKSSDSETKQRMRDILEKLGVKE